MTEPPAIELADFIAEGTCAQTDPEEFFPTTGGGSKKAKRVCLGCPVRSVCLEWALTHPEDAAYGTWGGLTASERDRRRWRRNRIVEGEDDVA